MQYVVVKSAQAEAIIDFLKQDYDADTVLDVFEEAYRNQDVDVKDAQEGYRAYLASNGTKLPVEVFNECAIATGESHR